MKAFITMFDVNGHMEGTIMSLFRELERASLEGCDVVIIPITVMDFYKADVKLMADVSASGKKIVIVDFVEYGWDVLKPDHLFGVNTNQWLGKFGGTGYITLDKFIEVNIPNIILYFKRELITDSALNPPFKVLPVEYPGVVTLPENPTDSLEEFNNRPIDVFMTWGLSNPSRPILHGEFVKQSALNGQHLVSNIGYFPVCYQRGEKRMIVMAHIPDFARTSNDTLFRIQKMAKISISLGGAGKKCFRDSESSYNSVMARQENGLEWSSPWVDYNNSIVLPNREGNTLIDEHKSYQKIMECLDQPEALYQMYLNGISNWGHYEAGKYAKDYILKEIQKVK